MNHIYIFLGTTVVFFAIDMLWLGFIAVNFYKKHLGYLLRPEPLWPAAIVFYLFYVVGVLYFASYPAVQVGDWTKALVAGALFGALAYATYDLTNYATVKDWPWIVVVVDILWGTILTSTVAVAGYFIAKAIL